MMNNTQEEWRDVKGYEGLYQVSNLGNVKKLSYLTANGHRRKDRLLKIQFNKKSNYVYVDLIDRQNTTTHHAVAALVLYAFKNTPPKYLKRALTKHLDGDVWNNHVDNLEWVVRRNCFMPENIEARKMFNEHIYDYMKRAANAKRIKEFSLGCYDIDDLYQETALDVWLDIDTFDLEKYSFMQFVAVRLKHCFARAYRSKIDRVRRNLSFNENLSIDSYNQYLKKNALPW